MAKTQAGLLSMGVSGSIGGIMTFASWKGRQYARRLVVPSNPNSAAQRAVRAGMSWGSKEWAQLTALEQATWEAAAVAQNYLPFNAFVSQGQSNIAQDLGYQSEDPPPGVAAPGIVTLPVAVGGKGQATLTWVDPVGVQNFGHITYMNLGGVVTPSTQNIGGIADMGDLGDVIVKLDPGVWHFKVKTFNKDGLLGTATADFTATVT